MSRTFMDIFWIFPVGFRNLTDSLITEFKRMPEYLGDFGSRLAGWKKAREWPSELMANALEQVDAAVWLIGGTRHSEALTSLQSAIELLFKAQLHSVHPLLIAANFDYKPFRGVPLQQLRCHPQLPPVQPEEFDIDRTITCNEARIRVEALYPVLKIWRERLLELQNLRNQLIHYGSKRAEEGRYVRVICVSAIPFLEMFLELSSQIDLGKLLGEPIFRELGVARRVCEAVERSGRTDYRHALKTVAAAVVYRDIEFPAATDREGWVIDDDDREYHVGESLKRYAESQWKTDPVEVFCKICGSVNAYAGIYEFDDVHPVDTAPQSLACARCGLMIDRNDFALASVHFGPIPAADILGSG